MIRIASPMRILGLSGALVVGMSASGVASTFQPADVPSSVRLSPVRVSQTTPGATSPVSIEAPGDTQVTKKLTREEQIGVKALVLIKFNWRESLPGWRVRFLPPRKGYLAITFREQRRIDVYVRTDRSTVAIAHDIAHELGHAVDVTYFDDERRSAVRMVRDLRPETSWWACNACTDLQTGAGDFAETFAMIAAPRYKFYSELGQEPTAQMLTEVSVIVTDAITSA